MKLKITLMKSTIGLPERPDRHGEGAGPAEDRLRRSCKPDNPAIRGMIFKVKHLVSVEEIED